MTKPEHDFFIVLARILQPQYYVFPQIHISSLVDEHIDGQSWEWARRLVNARSVDYLVCSRDSVESLLAIEFDDATHRFWRRRLRDQDVVRIFNEVHLPLLRFRYDSDLSEEHVRERLMQYLDIE